MTPSFVLIESGISPMLGFVFCAEIAKKSACFKRCGGVRYQRANKKRPSGNGLIKRVKLYEKYETFRIFLYELLTYAI